MVVVNRVLSATPIAALDDYLSVGGGAGLTAARAVAPDVVIGEIEASGLRGRGGAGFPTGKKWRTVRTNASDDFPTMVVVNAAEGEPGTFKDRAILANNPFQVVEGALIAAVVVGATRVVFAVKASAEEAVARLRAAINEVVAAGLSRGVSLEVFEGPGEYLYGEETALLEALNGRPPFPRVAPPYRRGALDVVESAADVDTGSGVSAHVEMAGPDDALGAPPALVNNVETMANIPAIVARGAAWFRSVGTEKSPGTIVCTVSGATLTDGVGEVAMGTPLREVIDTIGGGVAEGSTIKAVLPGVASALIPASALDTPLTYEAMASIGSGLGSAGFIVFDDTDDLTAAVAGASRFLAVESCGQCTPCKQDGLALSELLGRISASASAVDDVETARSLVKTVANEARCSLAAQHEVIVASLLDLFPDEVAAHVAGTSPAVEPLQVAEFVDLRDGQSSIDDRHSLKQADWTYDDLDSGKSPADRLADHRAEPDR